MSVIKIFLYSTDKGKEPFSEWEDKLDKINRAIIMNRLDRIKLGNFGDAKPIQGKGGIWELRIDRGPGYRVYFGKDRTSIVLLAGGNKKSQSSDISKAKKRWLAYKGLS